MNNRDHMTDLCASRAQAKHPNVGLFARIESTVDEVTRLERVGALETVQRRMPSTYSILLEHIAAERDEATAAARADVGEFLRSLIGWACFPVNHTRVWAMNFVFDLGFNHGLNMSQKANQLGMHRASISNAARECVERFNLPPSRWMRGEETARRNRRARNRYCK